MDYAVPDRRKTKNDKRAKGKFTRYKRGGQHRVDGIATSSHTKA